MRCQLLSFSSVLFSGILLRTVGASCYYPNGTFPTDYVYSTCTGDEFTSCCIASEGDQCMSNGLCYYPQGDYLFRGGCSDKNWNSPNCFQHCKNATDSYSKTYNQIVKCGGDRYCCRSDGSTCCNDDSKVFKLGAATVVKDLATTAGGSTKTGLSVATVKPALGQVPPDTTGSPSASSSSAASHKAHSTSKTTIIVIAAISVGALAVIIGLVWFFMRRHYRNKVTQSTQEFPMSGNGFEKLPDKSPRPVEVPAPLHAPYASPAPPYQPPAYQQPANGAVEIDSSYLPPQRNQWGQPVYEAPAQPYRHV